MSTLTRDPTKAVMMLGGLGYLILLCIGLIWMHLPPQMVLALTAGPIALVAIAVEPFLGVHAFIMILYIEFAVPSEGGLTITKAFGVTVFAGWILSIAVRRRANVRFDVFLFAMLAFVAWCGISITGALEMGAGFARLFSFVQLGLVTVMIGALADTPRRLSSILYAVVIWTTLSTIIALAQLYGGFTSTARWLVGDRNCMALYIDVAIVCAYFLYQSARSAPARLILLVSLPILFLGLALTLSRAGLIGFVVALLCVWYRIVKERRIAIILASLLVLAGLTAILPEAFWNRVGTILPAVTEQRDTFGTRLNLWKVGYRMAQDRPILGVGPGNFTLAFTRYERGGEVKKANLVAHNSYVEVMAEMGYVGLALFVLLHLLALREARRAGVGGAGLPLELIELGRGIEISIIVIMVCTMSISSETLKYLWIFFALAVGAGRIALRVRSSGPRNAPA